MHVHPLEEPDESIASRLADHYASRNLDCDTDWALAYLEEGHKNDTDHTFFRLEDDDDTIGVVSLVVDTHDVAEIKDLIVDDESRLMEALMMLEQRAATMGVRKLYALESFDRVSTFEDVDFEQEGILQDHYVEGETLVIMSKFV
jgi:hypothetical protein